MTDLDLHQLNPYFVAEAAPVALPGCQDDDVIDAVRHALDVFAVVIFRDQRFSNEQQLDFARRLGGPLHEKTGANVVQKNRLGHAALTDISNVNSEEAIHQRTDRRRLYSLGNRLWHTDASFQDPPGRYSLLSARVVPPVSADTQFADMRAAYDALDKHTQEKIEDLRAHHSIAYSRQTLGFEFSQEEADALPGAVHPLVRQIPRTNRKSLYLASHASKIIDWPTPDGRLLISDLKEHATQPHFVYQHAWREGDLVIWDNRATMHRGVAFDDARYRRELCRVTTLDV